MVSGWREDPEPGLPLVRYTGVPAAPQTPGEHTRWRRFLEWALPWLKQKWSLAEALAEAKVRQEVAHAAILEEHAHQEAIKTVDLAARLESDMLERLDRARRPASASPESDLHAEIEELRSRLESLYLKHGTRFELRAEQSEPPPELASQGPSATPPSAASDETPGTG